MRSKLSKAVPLLALALAACGSPLDPTVPDENGRVLGTIAHYGDPVRVMIPEEVVRGRDVTVEVITYGGGCISQGETDVQVDGLMVVVTPYDRDVSRQLSGNAACLDVLQRFSHRVTVRFGQSGIAWLLVRGLEKPDGEIITRRYTIEVR